MATVPIETMLLALSASLLEGLPEEYMERGRENMNQLLEAWLLQVEAPEHLEGLIDTLYTMYRPIFASAQAKSLPPELRLDRIQFERALRLIRYLGSLAYQLETTLDHLQKTFVPPSAETQQLNDSTMQLFQIVSDLLPTLTDNEGISQLQEEFRSVMISHPLVFGLDALSLR